MNGCVRFSASVLKHIFGVMNCNFNLYIYICNFMLPSYIIYNIYIFTDVCDYGVIYNLCKYICIVICESVDR